MLTHEEMVKKMLTERTVKAAYDAQAEEFALLDELLQARRLRRLDASGSRDEDGHQDSRCGPPGGWRGEQAALAVGRDAA